MTQDPEKYVNSEEASSILGISRRTLERYAKEGRIQRYKRGARILFRNVDILQLKKQLEEPQPEA
jgi:excisionase family DNA binding protein